MKKFTVTFEKEFDAYDLQDCENRLLEFFQLAKSEYVESEIMPEFKYEERKAKREKRRADRQARIEKAKKEGRFIGDL